jgi:hypothetical protein
MPVITSRRAVVRRPSRPPHYVAVEWADMYAAIGLDQRAEQIRRVIDRCATTTTATGLDDLNKNAVDVETRGVLAVAYQGKSIADVLPGISDAKRLAGDGPLVATIAAKVRVQLHYDVCKAWWTEGDALVHELDAVVRAAAERVGDLALLIPDTIGTDGDAIRAGGAVAKAWSALLTEAATITTAQALAASLRLAEMVPGLPEAGELDWIYRTPDDVVDYDPARHPMRTLLLNIPAGPCCATGDEIVARVYGSPR